MRERERKQGKGWKQPAEYEGGLGGKREDVGEERRVCRSPPLWECKLNCVKFYFGTVLEY